MSNHSTKLWVVVCLLLIAACNQQSESGNSNTSIDQPPKLSEEELLTLGSEKYGTCMSCHGAKGEGNESLGAPALSGLESWYIERQLHNYQAGIRGTDTTDLRGQQMWAATNTLPDSLSIQAVSLYIEKLEDTITRSTLSGDLVKGKANYNRVCGACHGTKAKGIKSLNAPGLQTIDDWYLVSQYRKFQNGQRGSHPDDTYGAQMKMMSNTLVSKNDILDVVAYIHSLRE